MKLLIRFFLLLCLASPTWAWSQCNNGSAFGSAIAPTVGIVVVTSCNFAGEYHEIMSCAAATSYQSASDIATDFLTVRRGTPGGPVVAAGTTPLNWTSTVAGSYFVHVNVNSGCGTDFSCHSLTIERLCPVAAPTLVSATPSTVCSGVTSNLRATSAGNTIQWFTVPSGGTPIGTSASGANFAVIPSGTTTYYAAGFNGSCAGLRTAVTVTVNPTPVITTITATPNPVCQGNPVLLNVAGCSITSGFAGTYAPLNWSTAHIPAIDQGIVQTAGAPNSVTIESSNAGNSGVMSVYWSATMPCNGTLSFNWNYVTTDVDGPSFDYPEYAVNMVNMGTLPGWSAFGANSQSGSFSLAVTAGQVISLIMTASDDILGSATTVYSSFIAPSGSPGATVNWFTVPSGGVSIGSSLTGANFSQSPGSTVTYYAQATLGGCTSTPRLPITVTVNICVLPTEVHLRGNTDGTVHYLQWESLEGSDMPFEVERSLDGVEFVTIGRGKVLGQNANGARYSFDDHAPMAGDNYYRLRFHDLDGGVHSSNVVLLNASDPSLAYSFAPNPSRGQFTYEFAAAQAEALHLVVTDMFGQSVLQIHTEAGVGMNRLPLDLQHCADGMYLVQVRHGQTGTVRSSKIVKRSF